MPVIHLPDLRSSGCRIPFTNHRPLAHRRLGRMEDSEERMFLGITIIGAAERAAASSQGLTPIVRMHPLPPGAWRQPPAQSSRRQRRPTSSEERGSQGRGAELLSPSTTAALAPYETIRKAVRPNPIGERVLRERVPPSP